MSRNDAADYAQRLYERIPAHYRVYDAERDRPLFALIRVVAEQVANLRQDMDALWDNYFIETCDDWAVPYIAALVGTNLLPRPVGQGNRLDVRNTVLWRRSKGTPAMLRALAQAISGWPVDLAEFFQTLGWSQNMNHLRLDHPLTVDLRDPARLALLGRAADPWAHAIDIRPARALDQARVTPDSLGIGRMAWGTPGRYNIKNLGFFARRLQTFAVRGATPAAATPGTPTPPNATCFTFDPLHHDTPLFDKQSGEPINRAMFDAAPWTTWGSDIAVRQWGVLLASDTEPTPEVGSSREPWTFGDRSFVLDADQGLRLMEPRTFELGAAHFIITALRDDITTQTPLGSISTLHAALGTAGSFNSTAVAAATGRLTITVQTGRSGLGWAGLPVLPPSPGARFPGAVLVVRMANNGALRSSDALYVYLPPAFVTPADTLTYHVADDGSTYSSADLSPQSLARATEGQVYPPRVLTASPQLADEFTTLQRTSGGLRLIDTDRFGAPPVAAQYTAELFTGAFQMMGAIATVDRSPPPVGLAAPDPWPAFSDAPSVAALNDDLPPKGLLTIHIQPLAGDDLPPCEVIVANRMGRSLLVYLPEVPSSATDGVRVFVSDDGSTFFAPADNAAQLTVLDLESFVGLKLARASAGQVLPIEGLWPIQQRRPVAINLCRCARHSLLQAGELGIDPEQGRWAFAPGDPAIARGGLSVDYVEAFSDRVGARTFDRQLDPAALPTRLVAQTGDARSALDPAIARDHLHATLADALAAAQDGEVIEIVDSATYTLTSDLVINNPAINTLTLRAAAAQRPCLVFASDRSPPELIGLRVLTPMDRLELNGLLISGGPIRIESHVQSLELLACTLDPRTAGAIGSLIATDADLNHRATYLLCRSISGGIRTGAGIDLVIVADSIVDQQGSLAIGGVPGPLVLSPPLFSPPIGSPPILSPPAPPLEVPAQQVQLERVTVLGRVRCEVLSASECILDDIALVEDRQVGCVRFSRYEIGSLLPRRFQCVPSDEQTASCQPPGRCVAPLFNARRFGRPDYAQLAAACPPAILQASEIGAEIGAFASALNPIRLDNMQIKLEEFMPVGLNAIVIAET